MKYMNPLSLRGFSLVELMIAMTLGLVLMLGLVTVLVSQQRSNRTDDALAHMQENARIAFETLSRDIRMAGSTGCGRDSVVAANVIANDPPADAANVVGTAGVLGFDNGSYNDGNNPNLDLATTDAIRIFGAGACNAHLTGNMNAENANIQVEQGNGCGWAAGDLLVITDCKTADVFRATNVSKGGAKITIAHANNQNTDNRLSKAYDSNASVMSFESADYFIRNNTSGQPALYRRDTAGNVDEIAPGIMDMQLTFGIDPAAGGKSPLGGDVAVARYDTAATVEAKGAGAGGWDDVYSVRLCLVTQSEQDNVTDVPQPYTDCAGAVITPNDRRLRRTFTYVVNLRN